MRNGWRQLIHSIHRIGGQPAPQVEDRSLGISIVSLHRQGLDALLAMLRARNPMELLNATNRLQNVIGQSPELPPQDKQTGPEGSRGLQGPSSKYGCQLESLDSADLVNVLAESGSQYTPTAHVSHFGRTKTGTWPKLEIMDTRLVFAPLRMCK